jgi:hypothetical protein
LELGTWDFFGVWSLVFGVSIPGFLWSLRLVLGVSLGGGSKTGICTSLPRSVRPVLADTLKLR